MHAAWYMAVLSAVAQASPADEAELKELLIPYYEREAVRYEFFLDKKHEHRLQLHKQPVMTWTNTNKFMGAVFVWTYGGRPEVIGCIGSRQSRPDESVVFHEFHSLSTEALEAVQFGRGNQRWTPSRAGVELTVVEGVKPPNDSDRLRLTQMRNIAREFNGWMKDNQDVTQLRLLPQPLFRYSAPERGVVDGAIFAFVWKGTDPEILLILEDRKGETGTAWYSSMARFNYREMWVTHNEREVWRVGVERKNDIYITGEVGAVSISEIRAAEKSDKK